MSENTETVETTAPVEIVLDEERMDLPSASKWQDFVIDCPGHFPLLRSCKDQIKAAKEETTEAAQRGTRIHKARETMSNAGLIDDSEITAFKTGCKLEIESVAKWKEDYALADFVEGPLELRIWGNNPETLQPEVSARLDVHYIGKREGSDEQFLLLHDWKSGCAMYRYCPPAARNWQMKVAAVLAADEYGAKFVRVELNRMEHRNPHVDRCDYNEAQLESIRAEMREQLALTNDPLAPRRPGDCCGFCPCKALCPEAIGISMLPLPMADCQEMVGKSKKEVIAQKVAAMTPLAMAYLWRRSSIITNIVDAVKARLKTLPEAELAQLQIRLGPGTARVAVPPLHTKAAIEALVTAGIPDDEAWKMMKVDLGLAAAWFQENAKLSEDGAKERVRSIVEQWLAQNVGEKILRELK